MASATSPLFVMTTGCAELVVPKFCDPNCNKDVENCTAAAKPEPLKETERGLPAALSVNVSVPARTPRSVGENCTETTQEADGFKDAGQLLDWEKSPDVAMLEIARTCSPELVSVIVCAALVVPKS